MRMGGGIKYLRSSSESDKSLKGQNRWGWISFRWKQSRFDPNDGAPLAVRIAALKYPRYQKHPKVPTITFYPQNWLHSALLKQLRVASTEFEKKFDPRGRERGV